MTHRPAPRSRTRPPRDRTVHDRPLRRRTRSAAEAGPDGTPRAGARPRPESASHDALDHLRAAYHTLAPSPDLVARVARAIRAPAHRGLAARRRRRGITVVGTVLLGLLAGFVGARLAGIADDARDRPVLAGTRAPSALAAPEPRDAPATRLASLLATAVALPRPDAATRHVWTLATFDPDVRVREAAALLLLLAAPVPPERGP